MTHDEMYMRRCLQLASLGLGKVQPNPMVGAVIVHQNQIIGEGYHHQYGQPHAEVNAFNSVSDKSLLKESTLYVSLEPCSHYGKTPPCAEAIIRYGVPKVVVGITDPHDKVNGNGIRMLQEAGIEVVQHVCESECRELNRRFFTYHQHQRPYIILKWAQTADGFMDIDRTNPSDIHDYWITNQALKVIVHKWRSEEDAILIGYNTMVNDKPQLTNRLYPGKSPQRYVLCREHSEIDNTYYHSLPTDLSAAMHELYEQRIQSVIVEGGRKTLDAFIVAGLWDEARILVGAQRWSKGTPAPALPCAPEQVQHIDDNTILYVRRHL